VSSVLHEHFTDTAAMLARLWAAPAPAPPAAAGFPRAEPA
jgi:hypothetical protein